MHQLPFYVRTRRTHWMTYFEKLTRESEWTDVGAIAQLSCAGWPKIEKGFQVPVGGKTHSPILFIGNMADPVTPLAFAKIRRRIPACPHTKITRSWLLQDALSLHTNPG
ncbi:hypothetical protein P691DRAFT_228239 [Macrolepiota fuliginosa MF-IS2]|uniref:Peptidase S33 tripeptidyl aminopeptidase-like C-terminal domain-containing protein n=1 Tax=Macrolepiota fuliginosa MF-IS2 TaxID=1400762 RepID=A0A9P5X7V3_9AGAR|nr:hypothetical protein P691DRAFT_228239 [Macrolepiota fuliginosa MF-IS2]